MKIEKIITKKIILFFIFLNCIDYLTTVFLLDVGFVEANRILAMLFNYNIFYPFLYKFSIVFLSSYIFYHYWNSLIIKGVCYGITGLIYLVVINNFYWLVYWLS